ncbi:MAG: HAMP domain-containing histidine kinase [Ignavibacteria bacterium]|nr:HAMP domain-containing histidine kinase [Ignavibacteria bacterium]
MKKVRSSIFNKVIFILTASAVIVFIFIFFIFFNSPAIFNRTTAFISIVIFFIFFFTALYFSFKKILSPLKDLSTCIKNLNNGNSGFRLNVKSKDEFGQIAETINELNDTITNSVKAKETLLIDVSHELRTPLTKMKLSSEFITDEKIKSRIKDEVNEMEHMVTELLDNYKKENEMSKPVISEFDLNELIESAAGKFTPERIDFPNENQKLLVKADRKKIETVIKNLIDNALKYSSENIKIISEKNPDNSNGFILRIKDYGAGIPDNEIKYIFEPFYRVDKSRNKSIAGYGLGLNIVKKIIEAHNGTIEVKSEKDKGTEFIVKI